jgi:hypothetical protein
LCSCGANLSPQGAALGCFVVLLRSESISPGRCPGLFCCAPAEQSATSKSASEGRRKSFAGASGLCTVEDAFVAQLSIARAMPSQRQQRPGLVAATFRCTREFGEYVSVTLQCRHGIVERHRFSPFFRDQTIKSKTRVIEWLRHRDTAPQHPFSAFTAFAVFFRRK